MRLTKVSNDKYVIASLFPTAGIKSQTGSGFHNNQMFFQELPLASDSSCTTCRNYYFSEVEDFEEISIIREIDAKINIIKDFYKFSDILGIKNFLYKNIDLIDYLFEAPTIIKKYLSDEKEILLELDNYEEEKVDTLVINVLSEKSPEEIFEMNKILDSAWGLDLFEKTKSKMLLTVNCK